MMNGRADETQTAFCAKLWITTCTLIIIFILVIVTESHQLLLRRVYYACMIYTNFIELIDLTRCEIGFSDLGKDSMLFLWMV